MLKPVIYLLIIFAIGWLSSCKINQTKDGLKTGLWVTKDGNGEEGFKSRGRYKKGKEIGVWKYFYNDTLYQKDKYSGMSARVRFYHPNKKIRASGKTEMDYNGKMAHWYYSGNWRYFDTRGKLVKTITYKKGSPIAEIPANKLIKQHKNGD
jgi:antitoxin component YwqK of YwqJK toxin-antitoxin module